MSMRGSPGGADQESGAASKAHTARKICFYLHFFKTVFFSKRATMRESKQLDINCLQSI